VAGEVVVCVGVDGDAALLDEIAILHPLLQFARAVDDRFVPGFRLLLDALAVAEPADVGEVGGDWIEALEPFGGARHPRLVDQSESDAPLAQRVHEFRDKPVLVANLDRELVAARQLFQERQEPGEKFVEAGKSLLIEIAELEEHRAELFAEEVRGGEEGLEFGVAIVQDLFVGDLLRDFQGEDEVFGRLGVPAAHRGRAGSAVEGRVHFHGVEFRGVVGEVVGGLHPCRIERAFPSCRCKRRSSDPQFCHGREILLLKKANR